MISAGLAIGDLQFAPPGARRTPDAIPSGSPAKSPSTNSNTVMGCATVPTGNSIRTVGSLRWCPLEGRQRDFRTGSAWFAISVGQPRRRAVHGLDDRGLRPSVGGVETTRCRQVGQLRG